MARPRDAADDTRRPGPRLPELVAHRGWTARFPENTLPALEAAIDARAAWIEVDVQISSDGVPVLFHDRTLARMCGVPGAVHERTLAELSALSCGEMDRFGDRFAATRIAELAELVRLLVRRPDVSAFVEIKRAAIARSGAEAVLDRVLPVLEPVRERVALISFSLPFLAAARARTALPLGAVFDSWREAGSQAVRALDPEYVFCDLEGLPARGELRQGQGKVAVYEVADPRLAIELAGRGVDLVETFAIGEMLAAFREIEASRR